MKYLIAFLGGLLSFVSPCVLPLIPVYFGIITGLSLRDMEREKVKVLTKSFLFVFGFSVAFTSIGVSASALGNVIKINREIFTVAGGVLMLIFGLHLIGVLRIPFLLRERKIDISKINLPSEIFPFVFGFLFAVGWTPCVGPVLAGILTIAASSEKVLEGGILLLVYSFGLGLPLILSAIFIKKFVEILMRFRRFLKITEVLSGLFLISISLFFITGKIERISAHLSWFSLEKEFGGRFGFESIKVKDEEIDRIVREVIQDLKKQKSLSGFTVEDIENKRIIFLNFWAPWCPPCKAEIPHFVKEVSQNPDFSVIGITYKSSEDEVSGFVRKMKINYPIYLDKEFDHGPLKGKKYSQVLQITGLPETIIIFNGKFVERIVGPFLEGEVEKKIAELTEKYSN